MLLSSCHVGLPGLPPSAVAQMHKRPEDAFERLGSSTRSCGLIGSHRTCCTSHAPSTRLAKWHWRILSPPYSTHSPHPHRTLHATRLLTLLVLVLCALRSICVSAPYYVVAPGDVAAVAATALTTNQYDYRAVEVIGPAVLSDRQQLAARATVIGKPIEVQEISRAERAQELNRHVPVPAVSEAILDYYEWRQKHGPDVWVADELVKGATSVEQWAMENKEKFTKASR